MKKLLVQLIALGAAAAAVAPVAVWWNRLPDRVAVHWTIGGHPNGAAPKSAELLVAVGLAVALGIVGIVLAQRVHHGAAVAVAMTVFTAWIVWTIVLTNRGARDWHHAHGLGPIEPLGGVVLMGVALVGTWRLLPPLVATPTAGVKPSAGLTGGERASWSATIGWSPLLPAAVALLAIAVALVSGTMAAGVGILLIAVSLTAFTRIRVTIDRRGVRIRYGWLPWPRTSVPLAKITAASAIDLHPLEWGGWGYRVRIGSSALVLHRGPALVLDLTSGRKFAVTIPDAQTAAGVVNDLRDLTAVE